MTPKHDKPVCDMAYRKLLRLMGGRATVPKGGEVDRALIHAVNVACFIGASRERDRTLGLCKEENGGKVFMTETGQAAAIYRKVIEKSIDDTIRRN